MEGAGGSGRPVLKRRVVPVASALLLAVAAWRLGGVARDPRSAGIDFWHFRSVRDILGSTEGDPYSRRGRSQIFRLAVLPVLERLANQHGVVDGDALLAQGALTREARAALQTAQIDVPRLGYEGVETVATPFLLALFGSAAGDDYEADHRAYAAASVMCLVGGVFLLGHLAGFSGPASAALAAVACLVYVPARVDLAVGNVNSVLLGLLAASLWVSAWHSLTGDVAAGMLQGLAVCFKPSVALILPFTAVAWAACGMRQKLLRTLTGVGLGTAVALVASTVAWNDRLVWAAWATTLPEVSARARSVASGNYALIALVPDVDRVVSALVALLLVGLIGTLVAVTAARLAKGARELAGEEMRIVTLAPAALALAATLLASPLAWVHYYVLLLPLIVYILGSGTRATSLGQREKVWARGTVVVAAAAFTRLPVAVCPACDGVRIAVLYVAATGVILAVGTLLTLRLSPAASRLGSASPTSG